MEIDVPAECKLTGYDIQTDSLEVYERLLAEAPDPHVTDGKHVGTPDKDGIAHTDRRFFFYMGIGEHRTTVWVKGPPKRVKVTVEDV